MHCYLENKRLLSEPSSIAVPSAATSDYRPRHAFTLIELLIVIGIIALLVSLLLPVLSKSQTYVRSVTCQGNLHQWGLVFEVYTEEHNHRFFGGPLDAHWDDWVEIMEPYYEGQKEIMCCPLALKTRAQGGRGVFAAWNDSEGDYGSYGLNAWICDTHKGIIYGPDYYWRTPDQSHANTIPILADALVTAGWPVPDSEPPKFNGQLPQAATLKEQMKSFCIDRHSNHMTNVLFMDGSVKPVSLKGLWKLKWNRKFNTNGPWTAAGGRQSQDWPEWIRNLPNNR